ncbi:MAG: bacillithiol biosynthesis BshC [Holophagales bacterium]|nr:bacillithiol biosynthesis BshC [Holophagales bacterium]
MAAIASREERVLKAFTPRPGAAPALAALAAGRRAGVFTGQQVGLLTGPLLVAVKALAAVKIAEALAPLGTDLSPVFWCASEDHDLVEVTRVPLPGPDGVEEAGPDPEPLARNRRPVGALPVEVDVAALLERARAGAGSQADEESLDALRAAHAGKSYAGAFVASLSWLLAEPSLLFADAARPEEKPVLVPLAVRLVRERAEVSRLLASRATELAAAGHPPQVVSEAGALPLFALVGGERLLLRERDGGLELKGQGGERLDAEEIVDRFQSGEWLPSFSALSRPLSTSTLYPVAATVLGPAELAYWAQMLPLFDWAGLVPPVLVARPMAAPVSASGAPGPRAARPRPRGPLRRQRRPPRGRAAQSAKRPFSPSSRRYATEPSPPWPTWARASRPWRPGSESPSRRPGRTSVSPSTSSSNEPARRPAARTKPKPGRFGASPRHSRRGRPAERVYGPLPWLLRYGRAGLVGPLREQLRWDVAGLQEILL